MPTDSRLCRWPPVTLICAVAGLGPGEPGCWRLRDRSAQSIAFFRNPSRSVPARRRAHRGGARRRLGAFEVGRGGGTRPARNGPAHRDLPVGASDVHVNRMPLAGRVTGRGAGTGSGLPGGRSNRGCGDARTCYCTAARSRDAKPVPACPSHADHRPGSRGASSAIFEGGAVDRARRALRPDPLRVAHGRQCCRASVSMALVGAGASGTRRHVPCIA